MTFPANTALYAALLALIYLGLTSWVIAGRLGKDVLHGDGGDAEFRKRIRAHSNFIEYVPFALILIGLVEAGGGSPGAVEALLIVLVIARILHPIGMLAPPNSPRQYACRGGGILATLAVILVAAIMLFLRAG